MNITIAIPQGTSGTQTRTLEAGTYLVGRSPECDIPLSGDGSEAVSWNHAEISVRSDGAYLKDLRSSNGTFLNDRKLPVETKILDGDEIRFGKSGPRLFVQRVGAAALEGRAAAHASIAAVAVTPQPAAASPQAASPFSGKARSARPGAAGTAGGAAEQGARAGGNGEPADSAAVPRSSTTRALLLKMQQTQRGWRGVGIGVAAFLSIGLIVAIILVAVNSGSKSPAGRNSGGSATAGSDLDMAAISENYRQSVFLVAGMDRSKKVVPLGTAFVVDPQGTFATNAHVTELVKKLMTQKAKLYVIGEAGKLQFDILSATSHPEYKEKLPPKNYCPDVGLLKVKVTEGVALRPVDLGSESDIAELKDGTKLCYIGFPVYFDAAGGDNTEYRTFAEVKPRIEAGNVVRMLTLKGQVGTIQSQFILEHNMQSWGGASGSPIFNRNGRVVALHFAANPVVNKTKAGFLVTKSPSGTKFGIRVDKLKDLLLGQTAKAVTGKTAPKKI